MKKIFKDNLSLKFTLLIIIVIIVTLSIYTSLQYYNEKTTQQKKLLDKIINLSEILVIALTEPIWNYADNVVEGVINSIVTDPDIFAILILNPQKDKFLYSTKIKTNNDSPEDYLNDLKTNKYLITIEKEVTYLVENNTITSAYIMIIADNRPLLSIIKTKTFYLIITIILLAFVLIFFIYLSMNILILQPIKKFMKATKNISNQNYSPIDLQKSDELGKLASAFNLMQKELIKKTEELKVQEQLKKEMEIAHQIQTSLLPEIPLIEGLEIAAAMIPAEEVGGDYYDIIVDDHNNVWFAIGDVSGHGVTPGLVMMMAESSLNTYIYSMLENINLNPKDAVLSINKLLFENIRKRLKKSHFMTLTLLCYNNQGKFTYSGVHVDIIIYRHREKKCQTIKTHGIYLGIINKIEDAHVNEEFFVEENDIVILYTDGIIEAKNKNNDLFAPCRLTSIVEENFEKSADNLKTMIIEETLKWCDNIQADDITLIVIKKQKIN